MSDYVLASLKKAYNQQSAWLHAYAEKFESGDAQYIQTLSGITQDKSAEVAEEFRHQANNLRAVMDAYERLLSKTA